MLSKRPLFTKAAILAVLALWASSVTAEGGPVYTLYKNSPIDSGERTHVATFDSVGTQANWNKEECLFVARALNRQVIEQIGTDATFGFWCEPGRYSTQRAR